MPKNTNAELPAQLLEIAQRNVADALHHRQHALELDGAEPTAELDNGSAEAPTSLAETLARLLAVWTFTEAALTHGVL